MQSLDINSCTQINYNNVDLMIASTLDDFYRTLLGTSCLDMDHTEEKYYIIMGWFLNQSMKSVPIWSYGLYMLL
jgi:hypothetical protein